MDVDVRLFWFLCVKNAVELLHGVSLVCDKNNKIIKKHFLLF